MRDSFVFYRSFYDAIKTLPEESFCRLSMAIMKYAIEGEETELIGMEVNIFTLIKPQIDANNDRYSNGKRGGRPKTIGYETKEPMVKKEITIGYETKEPNDNVNDNVNDQTPKPKNLKNEEPRHIFGKEKNVLMTDTQRLSLVSEFGEEFTVACIETLSTAKAMKGYKYKRDDLAIRKWVVDEVRKQKPASAPVVEPVKPKRVCLICGSELLGPGCCKDCGWDRVATKEEWEAMQ